jgi:hypothetical protein
MDTLVNVSIKVAKIQLAYQLSLPHWIADFSSSQAFLYALKIVRLNSFLDWTLVTQVRLVMDKFGILAVRNAWYDPGKVTDHVIQGYTKVIIYF